MGSTPEQLKVGVQGGRIESLTSLRFFAALMVLFSHLSFLWDNSVGVVRTAFNSVFWEGYIGVTFFFILSGFILSHTYGYRFSSQALRIPNFYVGRILRVYPMHLITLVLVIPLAFIILDRGETSLLALLANIFLVQSYFPSKTIFFSMNIPSWSLSVEMLFYILFPFLIMRASWKLLLIGFLCVSWQFYVALSDFTRDQQHFFNYMLPFSRLLDFVVGILLYRLFSSYKQIVTKQQASYGQFIALVILLLFFGCKGFIPQAFRSDAYYVVPMAGVILSFSFNEGFLSRLLTKRVWVILGEASFSLYLIHHLVIRYGMELKSHFWGSATGLDDVFFAALLVLLSIALSVVTYFFVELKLQYWLKEKCKDRGWL